MLRVSWASMGRLRVAPMRRTVSIARWGGSSLRQEAQLWIIVSCARLDSSSHQRVRRGASHAAPGHTWTQQATTLSRTASIALRDGICQARVMTRRRTASYVRWADSRISLLVYPLLIASTALTASIRDRLDRRHVRTARWVDTRHRGRACSPRVRRVASGDIRTPWAQRTASIARVASTLGGRELRIALSVRLGHTVVRPAAASVMRAILARTLQQAHGNVRRAQRVSRMTTATRPPYVWHAQMGSTQPPEHTRTLRE